MIAVWRFLGIVLLCAATPIQPVALLKNGLSKIVGREYVVHSLRYFFQDRLHAKECPSDLIDQIGGWTTAGAGEGYGKGYQLEVKAKWLRKIE